MKGRINYYVCELVIRPLIACFVVTLVSLYKCSDILQ